MGPTNERDGHSLECATCEYMELPHDDGYCYMFRHKPKIIDELGYCAQHSESPSSDPAEVGFALLKHVAKFTIENLEEHLAEQHKTEKNRRHDPVEPTNERDGHSLEIESSS